MPLTPGTGWGGTGVNSKDSFFMFPRKKERKKKRTGEQKPGLSHSEMTFLSNRDDLVSARLKWN